MTEKEFNKMEIEVLENRILAIERKILVTKTINICMEKLHEKRK